MISPEGQRAVIEIWANGTDIVVGPKEQPQAAFVRLAGARNWKEDDANWRLYWKACFGEDYHHVGEGPAKTGTVMTATPATGNMDDAQSTPALDLVDRMRRLSVSSDTSSFSNVSVAPNSPSLQSLDSHGSIAGGVQVAQSPELDSTEGKEEQESPGPAPSPPASTTEVVEEATAGDKGNAEPKLTATACPFWYQFDGFKPSPTAKFRDEFARLAKHQVWGKSQKRTFQSQALGAEIAFHNGTCMQKLAKWQKLCEDMGVEKDLPSITQCRMALKKVFVNLWNVIDHRRNPDIPIQHFKSRTQFSKAIRTGNRFPRDIAKQDGFINVLLKSI